MDVCAFCKQAEGLSISLKHCSGCRLVSYCSRDHQKEHWKIHREKCSPFVIKHDPTVGRQWVATRDLDVGTLVSEEKSVLYCPFWEEPDCVCITCALKLDPEEPSLCSKCQWPICSTFCENHPIHADNECQVFVSQNISYPPQSEEIQDRIRKEFGTNSHFFSNPVSFSIEIIRGLGLKKSSPKKFAELLREAYKPDTRHFDHLNQQVNQLRFFKMFVNCELLEVKLDSMVEVELGHFIAASCGNKFTCSDNAENDTERAPMDGTFIKSTLMNHSCAPNCVRITRPFPQFATKIRTMVPVKKGEPLTINYFREGFELQGRLLRKNEIKKFWRFDCKCDRCLSPTELESYNDGVACRKCPSLGMILGYMFPVNPSDCRDTALWNCYECKANVPYSKIRKQLERFEAELETAVLLNDIEELENFVEKNSEVFLHPHHYLILHAYKMIVELLENQQIYEQTRKLFLKWRETKFNILNIEKFMSPISPLRGISMGRFSAMIISAIKNVNLDLSAEERVKFLKEVLMLLDEGMVPFKYDETLRSCYQSRIRAMSTMKTQAEAFLQVYESSVTTTLNISDD